MRRFFRVLAIVFAIALAHTGLAGAKTISAGEIPEEKRFVFLSSTIGPIEAGIVPALEEAFEKDTGIRVRHVGAGTGAALKMAEGGQIDLVLAHARSLEEKFVKDGFGTRRVPIMYNDFVIVGPVSDPAGIRGMAKASDALKAIVAKSAPFVSRGDKSGTHIAELEFWKKAGIEPKGPWYSVYEKGSQGNSATLRYVNEKSSYTVIDRATYLGLVKEIQLQILVEKDDAMLNYISLIPVSAAKFPRVHSEAAEVFVAWVVDPAKGQALIRDFGKEKFGAPLFFPNSTEYRKAAGLPAGDF